MSVNKLVTIEFCPSCARSSRTEQVTVLGTVVHAKAVISQSRFELVARDLGYPCDHTAEERMLWQRWWGMLYCAKPCWRGTAQLTENLAWYDAAMQQHVIAAGREHPDWGYAFVEEGLKKRDSETVSRILDHLGIQGATPLPPTQHLP